VYRRACEYAGVRPARQLARVGWDEVAKAFRERAWFAEEPELLSSLAESLSEEQAGRVVPWVALCPVLGHDGAARAVHAIPSELLRPEFPGFEHLPKRFMSRVSATYRKAAVDLLTRAGLRARPSPDDLRDRLLADDVTEPESISVLRYLVDEDRFRKYWELADLFRSPWFPASQRRLSTAEAVREGFIPDDLLENNVFRTWLGLSETHEPPPIGDVPAPKDPRRVLEDLVHLVAGKQSLMDREVRGTPLPGGTSTSVSRSILTKRTRRSSRVDDVLPHRRPAHHGPNATRAAPRVPPSLRSEGLARCVRRQPTRCAKVDAGSGGVPNRTWIVGVRESNKTRAPRNRH
jgi:hypothetical protein